MADSYWLRRQRRSDERMAKRERSLEGRVRRVYERQLRDLEREIADYYERYGEDGVLRYRSMLQTMDETGRRLLIEDCEEFARQHPELADMVEIRKSIYRLDRLEGLRTSVRLHLARATSEATGGLDEHFAQDAADAANAVAETMGYGSSFYSADAEVVRQFVGTAWSDGESYSDKIWKDARAVASYVERDLSKALVRGASYQSLCREMQKRFEGQSVSNIMRVVQTEGTYVARQAQGAEMRREGFEEYFIDPLGDKRTCDECKKLGRQSHETPLRFDEAEVGVNYPPIHPRCRCEVNPAVEDWDEWLRKRRAERREQAAASEVSDEAVAKRFGAQLGKRFGHVSGLPATEPVSGVRFDTSDESEVGRFVSEYSSLIANEPVEHAYVLQADGSVRHAVGTVDAVSLEGAEMAGAVVVHNHPTENGEALSFGRDDFDVMRDHGDIRRFVAVNEEYVYAATVLRPLDGVDYNDAYAGIDIMRAAEEDVQHLIMEWLDEQGYISYRRERRGR